MYQEDSMDRAEETRKFALQADEKDLQEKEEQVRLQEKRDEVAVALDRLMRLLRRGHRKSGRGRAAGRVLRTLMMSGGMTTRDLAKSLDVRISSLNEILKKLEDEGLVERYRSEMDGRIYVLVLSQKGRELAESIRRDRLARERQMVACLTEEERKEFVRLADKMAENLEDLEKYEDIKNWEKSRRIDRFQLEHDARLTVMMQLARCEARAMKNMGQLEMYDTEEAAGDVEENDQMNDEEMGKNPE